MGHGTHGVTIHVADYNDMRIVWFHIIKYYINIYFYINYKCTIMYTKGAGGQPLI